MKLQQVKQQIDNFMDITQERIKELEQQYQLTKNENWLVLKMDLEEQDFKSKCKELLELYKVSNQDFLCMAVINEYDVKEWKQFIDILFNYAEDFLNQSGVENYEAGTNYLFIKKSGFMISHREIRITFLKWLINL